jgi:hypothetical protein
MLTLVEEMVRNEAQSDTAEEVFKSRSFGRLYKWIVEFRGIGGFKATVVARELMCAFNHGSNCHFRMGDPSSWFV